jgi:hypothetical protein
MIVEMKQKFPSNQMENDLSTARNVTKREDLEDTSFMYFIII